MDFTEEIVQSLLLYNHSVQINTVNLILWYSYMIKSDHINQYVCRMRLSHLNRFCRIIWEYFVTLNAY